MTAMDRYRPIEDYALIGDCRSAALVSREGSIDWLCWHRFDSPSIFAALLDAEGGGRFRIRPAGDFRTERRYLPDTNVLETTFHTPTGSVLLRDLMPVAPEEEKRIHLAPDHLLLREIEGLAGEVDLEVLYAPRPRYGREQPPISDRGSFGFWCEAQGGVLILRSDLPLGIGRTGRSVRGRVRVCGGDRHVLAIAYTDEAPAVIPPIDERARQACDRTVAWWRAWAARCTYRGPHRDAVLRSALTLKLLTYAPSGAVIAAPTTSLPEWIGGVRNWDYRYCWLRDASFTLRAFFALGYHEEGTAFLNWMLHATRLTWPELHILYDVHGETDVRERELRHLEGYRGSRPVRVGNGAFDQLQLDVYGEVIDAAYVFACRGGTFDRDTKRLLRGLGQTVCRRWREPDEGIWEGRSGRFHHTHSKVLCWVALDRLIRLHAAGQIDVPADRFRVQRDVIRRTVERCGYNPALGSYTQVFDGTDLDAALLLLPLYGYVAADHPRMRSTLDRIRSGLGAGPLIYRYRFGVDDGLPPGEAAFGICSFWAVECRARAGELDAARADFDWLLAYANDVGLFAEEIDPTTGAALGNFPQAFTHLGLINAALTLAECAGQADVERISDLPAGEPVT
ncbi:MAG TPA: glycoside hydrolase family 15 protein [Dehalococcoidia bacterium]|nr:glycoside hydrolase family 15 protein [Dehalococcoidia bacterium]